MRAPFANIAGSFSFVDKSRRTAIDQLSSVGQIIVDTSSSCRLVRCGSFDCGFDGSASAGFTGSQPEQKMFRFVISSDSFECVLTAVDTLARRTVVGRESPIRNAPWMRCEAARPANTAQIPMTTRLMIQKL